jgi:hypothetical protein
MLIKNNINKHKQEEWSQSVYQHMKCTD